METLPLGLATASRGGTQVRSSGGGAPLALRVRWGSASRRRHPMSTDTNEATQTMALAGERDIIVDRLTRALGALDRKRRAITHVFHDVAALVPRSPDGPGAAGRGVMRNVLIGAAAGGSWWPSRSWCSASDASGGDRRGCCSGRGSNTRRRRGRRRCRGWCARPSGRWRCPSHRTRRARHPHAGAGGGRGAARPRDPRPVARCSRGQPRAVAGVARPDGGLVRRLAAPARRRVAAAAALGGLRVTPVRARSPHVWRE